MRLCFRCKENEVEKGYCVPCQTEYNRIWKSNHKKNPPKGMLKGNYRRAERDFQIPPVTMVYLNPKGGMTCGQCKGEINFIGTSNSVEGKEDRYACQKCHETIFIPHAIYPRIRVWNDRMPATFRSDGKRDNLSFDSNRIHVFDFGLQATI